MLKKPIAWRKHLLTTGLILALVQAAACSSAPSSVTAAPTSPRTAANSPSSNRHADAELHAAESVAANSDTPAEPGGSGATLQQVDGGPQYYSRFADSLSDSPSFFPIAVWLAAVNQRSDIVSDRAAGINTYIALTNNSNFRLVARSGMNFISNQSPAVGRKEVGWFVNDEADMWGGPGYAAWTGDYPGQGNICRPASAACGYTIQRTVVSRLPDDHRFRFANYGKGVTFWETNAQAARFVNRYQNVVSADNYWFTDDSICIFNQGGEFYSPTLLINGNLPAPLCHLAANYGLTVKRLRKLAHDREPVWAYVELGQPFTSGGSITPQQVVAAVWQSLIAGARGIIYFNHSFGGHCITDNVLRDACYSKIRSTVIKLDKQIRSLAPVLNAPYANGVVTASSGVNISTKWYNGHFYVMAGSSKPGAQTATFSMPCVGSAIASVIGEGRTITAANGTFTDYFANGNAVHIYRIDGGSSCGA